MLAAVLFGVRTARNRVPTWAGRTAVAVGALIAAFAAFLIHSITDSRRLSSRKLRTCRRSASRRPRHNWRQRSIARGRWCARPSWSRTCQESRSRSASAAAIVWAEGFGWRDVVTQTPVTPDTRFNIGTAAPVVTAAAVASLGLTNTGTDSAAEWSPDHIGEPEEDFPGFTAVHDLILRPIGISAPATAIAGRSRDVLRAGNILAGHHHRSPPWTTTDVHARPGVLCGGMAFYSTPSDLVRFALATKADSVNGELAGGSVMSLMTRRDNGIVVAVASNIAHANTAALALKVADVFAEQK